MEIQKIGGLVLVVFGVVMFLGMRKFVYSNFELFEKYMQVNRYPWIIPSWIWMGRVTAVLITIFGVLSFLGKFR